MLLALTRELSVEPKREKEKSEKDQTTSLQKLLVLSRNEEMSLGFP